MASLLLRRAGHVLRRSLPQGPFRRSPGKQFVDHPRLFSSNGVNKNSCMLEKGLHQRTENSLNSMEASIAAISRNNRATAEQLEVILQKKIENELADKKHERVVIGATAFLGIAICAGEFGGVKKDKCRAVKPVI